MKHVHKVFFYQVKLGALDATVHSKKAAEYGIQGYPTIKYFPSGKKISSSSAEEYNGGRTASDIINWALEKYSTSLPPPEVKQVNKYFFETLILLVNIKIYIVLF